jgi:hypothetical protein
VTGDPKAISTAPHPDTPHASLAENASGKNTAEIPKARGAVLWLRRIRALLLVTLCATLGVLLTILPWTPQWTDNPMLLSSPQLRDIVASNFVRGVVSGLGLLDLWLGFWEAIHYHEGPRNTSQ